VLPCSSVAPVTADTCAFRPASGRNARCECRKMSANVTQLPHSFSSSPKEILQKHAEEGLDPVCIGRLHIIRARTGNLTRETQPECELRASCVICESDN
jgi:hypothetical protein